MFGSVVGVLTGVAKAVGSILLTPQGVAVGLGAIIVAYILKKIDNEYLKGLIKKPFLKLAEYLEKLFYGLGAALTLGLSKWKWSAGLWNKTIEPYIVDAIDNIINGVIDGVEAIIDAIRDGFIRGLKSDNEDK